MRCRRSHAAICLNKEELVVPYDTNSAIVIVCKSLIRPSKLMRRSIGRTNFLIGGFSMGFSHRAWSLCSAGNRSYGYFWGQRFATRDGVEIYDEIALNPRHFKNRTTEQTLSTLVHEMVHLWQHHFGKPSRSAYHNRQWAAMMKEVDLFPSTTGEPGGRQTGQTCSHYIIPSGTFCCRLR